MRFGNPTIIFFESMVYPDALDIFEWEFRDAYSRGGDAIVLAIRSPGGYVNKVPEVARLIDRVAQEVPVFAYTDTLMASAAYWLASSADRIYAAPSADIGSVGAYIEMLDYAKYYERQGVEQKLFRAGDDKARLGFDGQMRESDAAEIQAELEDVHWQFKKAVLAHRDIKEEYLRGKIYSGGKALDYGFIDGFADSLTDFIQLIKGGIE